MSGPDQRPPWGGESSKPPGYYIHTAYGLFPAPLPQGSGVCSRVSAWFHFLGIFLAKALQDGRLVDLPLSRPFLRLLCPGPQASAAQPLGQAASNSATARYADVQMPPSAATRA